MSRHLLSAMTVLAFAVVSPAAAQTRATVVPSVHMGAVYDDNVSAKAEGDAGQMLQMRPSLEADYESPKVTLISLWSFDMQRSNHAALNDLDARRHAMVESRFKASNFTTWAVAGRYDHSDSPGELNIESGILSDRQNAQRYQVTPSLLHRFGQKATMTALYDWTTENILNEGPLSVDDRITLHVARTGFSRLLSSRSTVSAGYLGRAFIDEFSDHQSHAALMGFTRELRPFTTLSLQAGPRWTTYRGLVPEVAVSLSRDGQHVKTGLDYSHGETIILGVRGPVQIDTGSARMTLTVTRKIELGLRAGASSILTLDEKAAKVYRGTVMGSWSIGGPFTIAASYSADYQLGDVRRNLFRDERVLRHVARVGLTIAPSFSRSFLPPDEAARAKGVSR